MRIALSRATLRAPRWARHVLRRWSCWALDRRNTEIEKTVMHCQDLFLLRDYFVERHRKRPFMDAIS